MLPSMLPFATHAESQGQASNDLLDCCNLCMCLSRSGKKVAMDFVVGLPRTLSRYDSLWVIVH
jgi:hypothetical protein